MSQNHTDCSPFPQLSRQTLVGRPQSCEIITTREQVKGRVIEAIAEKTFGKYFLTVISEIRHRQWKELMTSLEIHTIRQKLVVCVGV
jgi:hypothetical protein